MVEWKKSKGWATTEGDWKEIHERVSRCLWRRCAFKVTHATTTCVCAHFSAQTRQPAANDRTRQPLSATRLFLNFWAANAQVPTTFAYPGSSLSLVSLPLRSSRLVAYPCDERIRASSRCHGNKRTFVRFPRWINVCRLRVVTGIVALGWRHLDTFTPTRVFYTIATMSKRLHYRQLLLRRRSLSIYRLDDRFGDERNPSHWFVSRAFNFVLVSNVKRVERSETIENSGLFDSRRKKRNINTVVRIVCHEVTRFQRTRVGSSWKRYAGRCRGRIPTDLFGRLIKRLGSCLVAMDEAYTDKKSRWKGKLRRVSESGRGEQSTRERRDRLSVAELGWGR